MAPRITRALPTARAARTALPHCAALTLALAAPALSGCFLPIATAAPQSAVTAGDGEFATRFTGELPTLNLLLDTGETGTPDSAVAPAAALDISLAYGLTDHFDLEATLHGMLWFFIIPLPVGGSIGARWHLIDNDNIDIGFAGRIGSVGLGFTGDGDTGDTHVNATYFSGSVVMQLAERFRPTLALQFMPTTVNGRGLDSSNMPADDYKGVAFSATASFELKFRDTYISPFIAATAFEHGSAGNAERFISAGFSLAFRAPKPSPFQPTLPAAVPAPPPPGPVSPPGGPAPPPPPTAPGDSRTRGQ